MVLQKGHTPWNKSLTKETDERVRKSSEKQSRTKKRMFNDGSLNIWNKGKHSVQIPWNKGLTKETDERVRRNCDLYPLKESRTCYFCGELIIKGGNNGDCLVLHSLDSNHDNWDPSNKVPVHRKCHNTIHHTGMSPMLGRKHSVKTLWKMSEAKKGKKNPMFGNTKAAKRGWITRRKKQKKKVRRKNDT